jgi:hypothetical protein
MTARRRLLVRGSLMVGGAAVVVAGLYLVSVVPPTPDSFYPKCVSYRLTGTHCPGCGLTRAVYSLLHGDLLQAFAYNPLFVLISPYLLFAAGRSLWFWLWGLPPGRTLFPGRYAWIIFGVMVAYWVLRNLPWYPFTLLAPHEIGG